MKLTYPTKLSFFRNCTLYSLKVIMVVTLLLVSNPRAVGQGTLHLGQGDTYVLSQPPPAYVDIYEGPPPGVVFWISFSGNIFDQGESLQVDILSSPSSLAPLATGIVTRTLPTSVTSLGFDWADLPSIGINNPWIPGWNPLTGAIRLTMLAGSVDVSGASLDKYYLNRKFSYSYTIPEPDVSSLLVFGGAVLGGARWFTRQKRRH